MKRGIGLVGVLLIASIIGASSLIGIKIIGQRQKNEKRLQINMALENISQKVQSQFSQLTSVCNANMNAAFSGKDFKESQLVYTEYKQIVGTGNRVILKQGEIKNGINTTAINYFLTDIKVAQLDSNLSSKGYTHTANYQLRYTLKYCPDGGANCTNTEKTKMFGIFKNVIFKGIDLQGNKKMGKIGEIKCISQTTQYEEEVVNYFQEQANILNQNLGVLKAIGDGDKFIGDTNTLSTTLSQFYNNL